MTLETISDAVAKAFGISPIGSCLTESHDGGVWLHNDHGRLFELCIENNITIEPYHNSVICHSMDEDADKIELYRLHRTPLVAACVCMLKTLAKLKGINYD